MAPKQRMRLASQKHSQNVNSRGNVPKSVLKLAEDKSPIGPYILALFIFVVCGSGFFSMRVIPVDLAVGSEYKLLIRLPGGSNSAIFQLIQSIRTA